MVHCLKCMKQITPARIPDGEGDELTWEMPGGALSFNGGWNFGSTLYDASFPEDDGSRIHVQLIVCDNCIRAAVASGLAREVHRREIAEAEPSGTRPLALSTSELKTIIVALAQQLRMAGKVAKDHPEFSERVGLLSAEIGPLLSRLEIEEGL